MNRAIKVVTNGVVIILIIILCLIIVDSLFLYKPIAYTFHPAILMIAIILYIFLLRYIYRHIIPKIVNSWYIPYILIAIFGILCLTISYLTRLEPKWDMGDVYRFALNHVTNGIALGKNLYLYQYPHNLMITLIYTSIIELTTLFSCQDYISILTVFNSIIAILMAAVMYKIVQELYGKEKAIMLLVLLIFTSPIYLHASLYYTDLISAFFAVCIFYLYIKTDKERISRNSFFYLILLGITLFIGIKIKMTVMIVFIAILIEQFILRNNKKTSLLYSIPTIICIICVLLFSYLIEPQILYIKEGNTPKIPIEHWIMMGLQGKGGYNEEDLQYTLSFPTYDEKKKADQEKIRQRLKQYDFVTFLLHLNEKIKYTWTDGTYFSINKIRNGVIQENGFNQTIIKDENFYKYFPQTTHIATMILILIYACSIIKTGKFANDKDKTMTLSIIGIFFFLLIWETRSRYIVTMLPFLLILQLNGIDIISNKNMFMNKNKKIE